MKVLLRKIPVGKNFRLQLKCPNCEAIILLDLNRFLEKPDIIGCMRCTTKYNVLTLDSLKNPIPVEVEKDNK